MIAIQIPWTGRISVLRSEAFMMGKIKCSSFVTWHSYQHPCQHSASSSPGKSPEILVSREDFYNWSRGISPRWCTSLLKIRAFSESITLIVDIGWLIKRWSAFAHEIRHSTIDSPRATVSGIRLTVWTGNIKGLLRAWDRGDSKMIRNIEICITILAEGH